MTNIASGQKRSREEVEIEANKRASRDGRDWRDVHLKSASRKPSGKGHGYDRRIPGYHDSNGRRGGETSSRGTRDSNSDSRRQGESHEKDKKVDRNRGDYRSSRSPQSRAPSKSRTPRIEEEKEEGE
jgi:hypothetical protein